MASALALMAAFLFAVAATLQQKGALNLDGVSLAKPMSLVRLIGQPMWLLGTAALLVGYVLQAGALDRGRLAVHQPPVVATGVLALPLTLEERRVAFRSACGCSAPRHCSWAACSRRARSTAAGSRSSSRCS